MVRIALFISSTLHCRGPTNTAYTFAIFKLVLHYLIFAMAAFCNHTLTLPAQKSTPLGRLAKDLVLTVLMCEGKGC